MNHAYDRDLRYSAVSKNLMLEHINHTKPKVRGRWWEGGGGLMNSCVCEVGCPLGCWV